MSDNTNDNEHADFEEWLTHATESRPMPHAMGKMGITVGDAVIGVSMGKSFWLKDHDGEEIPEDFTKIFLGGAMWACTLLLRRAEKLMIHLADTLEGDDLKELNEFLDSFGARGNGGSDE